MRDFLYEVNPVPRALDTEALKKYFKGMPLDHYIEGSYRRRRLSRFTGPTDALIHLPHNTFMQASYVNELLGNIQRDYEELEEALIEEPAFKALIQSMYDFFNMDPRSTVLGVHQIRISCNPKETGEPAPEGVHQDGFDYLCICCIDRVNIEGAATCFYANPIGEPIYSAILEPGNIAYVNDQAIYHYSTPIEPKDSYGYRDVFVITARCFMETLW